MADIDIKVAMDTKGAVQSTTALDEALKKMGLIGNVGKTFMSGLWKEVFAGVSIANVAGKAVHEFTQFIGDSITAARAADKANADLKSALGATGREVEANARHFINYASRLQKLTIYDDEAVKGAQALLLQLTTLDRDGIDRATRGAIGLASVLGIDLQSAAMLVAKAMEGNTGALGRYGIKVSETGTAEEKRAELLQKLEGFYKRATDATGTFAGKQAQLKNNLDEFKESVGKAIIENKILQKTVEDLSLSFQYMSEHGGILKKVVDGIFQGALGPGGMLLLKLMGGLADKQREINKAQEAGQAWADKYNKEIIALAKSGKDLGDNPILAFMVSLAKQTKEGHAAFKVTDEWAKQFGITLKTKVVEQINDARQALDRLRKSGEATPGAIEALNKKIRDLETYLRGVDKTQVKVSGSAKTMVGALTGQLLPAARKLNDVFAETPVVVAQSYMRSIKLLAAWVEKNREAIRTIISFAQQGLGLLQSAYSTYYSNRMTELDEESRKKQEAMDADYERRKKDIEDSTLSEDEKQKALAQLDKDYKDQRELAEKEYENKKKALQKQAAEKQKAVAVVQAVINTAEAATAALATKPFLPMGPFMLALALAMGAAQIAIIKSQKIPLAQGAMFDRPTLLAGGRYEVGEAGREVAMRVDPLMKEIRAAVAEEIKRQAIQIINHIYIGKEEMEKLVIKTVTRQAGLRRFKIPSAVVS